MIPRRGGTGNDFGREDRGKSRKPTASCSSDTTTTTIDTRKPTTTAKRKDREEEDDDHDEEKWGVEYLRRKHHFIRTTIRTDYQPDICKDYKETGFCGFGDSCKFLHDRTDYKHGWQLDQEYAKGEYKDEEDDKYLIRDDEEEGDEDQEGRVKEIDGVPIVCVICREKYKSPVVTKCKHYFCIDCAEKNSSVNCFTCQKPTSGIFKNASKIVNSKLAVNNDNKEDE